MSYVNHPPNYPVATLPFTDTFTRADEWPLPPWYLPQGFGFPLAVKSGSLREIVSTTSDRRMNITIDQDDFVLTFDATMVGSGSPNDMLVKFRSRDDSTGACLILAVQAGAVWEISSVSNAGATTTLASGTTSLAYGATQTVTLSVHDASASVRIGGSPDFNVAVPLLPGQRSFQFVMNNDSSFDNVNITAVPAAPTTPPSSGRIWWLDATTLSLANGDPVASWTASTGPNATQSISGSRPTYRTSQINGLPAVDFDGTDDYLTMPLAHAASDYTVVLVLHPDSNDTTNGDYYLDFQTGRLLFRAQAPGMSYGYFDGSNHSSGTSQTLAWQVLEWDLAATGATVYKDNVSILTTSYTQAVLGGAQALGTAYDATLAVCFDGQIAEVLIYDHALGSTDRTDLNAYLSGKYNLTL